MIIRMLNESDWDDYGYDYEDNTPQGETYTYKVDYYTYYKDSNEKEVPVCEKELVDLYDLPIDDTAEPDMEAESIKKTIDAEVNDGQYPGLWVHHIVVYIDSTYKQVDVDDWEGTSYVIKEDSGFDSEELELPDDWNESDPDYEYLADYLLY